MKIMIVDDERVQLESIRRGLKRNGYQVVEAINAEEALQHIDPNNKTVDMVITDYAMPGMNGMELLKRIRERMNGLPVIMMTAYGEKDLVIDALRNRCDSFIEKPFTLDQLLEEIARAKINILRNTNSHNLADLIPKLVHQINNPLMSIMGNAEICRLQMDDPAGVESSLCGILRATDQIQRINKEILNLGKNAEAETEPVDVKTIINDCLEMFADLITLKGIEVKKELNEGRGYVLGSRFGLEQLFKNLILNALDAMDGSPDKILSIRTESEKDGSAIGIKIEDTGGGIPEDSLTKIFTPFYTRKKNGTGLGLSVVKDVLSKHHGEIKIDSQVGRGTVFEIYLPTLSPH